MRLFGLTPEQIEAIEIPKPVRDAGLGAAAYMGKNHNKGGVNGGLGPTKRVVNVDEVKVEELSSNEKVEVLKQLRKRLLAVRMANTAASENSKPGETTTAMKTSSDNNDNNNDNKERKRYGEGRDQRRRERGEENSRGRRGEESRGGEETSREKDEEIEKE